jgi:hypothetical protein
MRGDANFLLGTHRDVFQGGFLATRAARVVGAMCTRAHARISPTSRVTSRHACQDTEPSRRAL